MKMLLKDGNNLLTLVKLTDAITASSVIKAVTSKTVLPSITARAEAQEEANQLNVINQLVISAKESVVEAITKLVGSNITKTILRTANDSDHKSIDEFTLYKVMKVAIDGANQPSTNDMLEQLIEVINHTFDFCKGQHQHGADAIEHGTNGHVWYCHWYPTAHTHAVGQHLDSHQIRLWL
jgi:hypothetical protein